MVVRIVPAAMARGVVIAVAALAGGTGTAQAHGPCECLPREVRPGQVMVVGSVARAVWNPTRRDILYREPALIAAHVNGAPRKVLLDRDRRQARRPARLVVPDAPAGRYLVLLFDGTEGGAHYTWDTVTVRGRPPTTARTSADEGGGVPPAAIALGVLLAGALAWRLLGLRRRRL